MKTKQESFFKKNFKLSFEFLKEFKWHSIFALGIFCLFFLTGFLYPYLFREKIIELITNLASLIEGKNAFQIISLIFFNNIKASFLAMILGLSFGLFPLITIIGNGYLLGFVARETALIEGISILWKLFPHGIFELPAIILAVGIGLKIGYSTILFIGDFMEKYKKKLNLFILILLFIISPLIFLAVAYFISRKTKLVKGINGNLKKGFRFFIFVIIPLLLIAAVIEGILIGIGL